MIRTVLLLVLLSVWVEPLAAASAAPKKFIEVGWDIPDTAFLREHWQEMERSAPFDGLNFYVTAPRAEGGRAAGTVQNLARNGDFSAVTPDAKRPAEWSTWQDDDSKGHFELDAAVGGGSAKVTQVKNGCFLQSHAAQPGETFVIEATCRTTGASVPGLMIRWQRADGSWVRWDADATFTFAGSRDGWAQAFGVVTVPDNAGKLVILLKAEHQLSDVDTCWFDNVGLYRMEKSK